MVSVDRIAQVLRGGIAAATLLAWACGPVGIALAHPQRPPAKSPASNPAAPIAGKQHDQELDSIRAEQRKSSETEQRLATESDAIANERRKLNQSLIAAASPIRAAEEGGAAAG